MRISDWSSDVCSADLLAAHQLRRGEGRERALPGRGAGRRLRGRVLLPARPAHERRGEDPLAAETRPGGIPGAALAVSADPAGAGRVKRRARPFPPPAAFSVVAVLAYGGRAPVGMLEIRGLTKSFGRLVVRAGINLDVE